MGFAHRNRRGFDVAEEGAHQSESVDLCKRFGVGLDEGALVGGHLTIEIRARKQRQVIVHVEPIGRSSEVGWFR